MSKNHISLITEGTYGDILPFVFLTQELQKRGILVTLFTNEAYKSLGEYFTIPIQSVTSKKIQDYYLQNKKIWTPRKTMQTLSNYAQDLYFESIEKILEETKNSDLIVSHPMTFSGKTSSELNNIPYVSFHYAPIQVETIYRLPTFFGGISFNWLPLFMKKKFYTMGDFFVFRHLFKRIPEWRKKEGLKSINDPVHWGTSRELALGLWPEEFCPTFKDQQSLQLCGFSHNVEYSDVSSEVTEEIAVWMRKKETIIITLGSGYRFIKDWGAIIDEIEKTFHVQCLILTPEKISHPSENIRYVSKILLSQILPLAKVCIHHGGAGMTTQTIMAGIPHLILPRAHDQPDNAQLVKDNNLGLLVWTNKPKKNKIIKTLHRLLKNNLILTNCKSFQKTQARRKDGIKRAADLIEGKLKKPRMQRS